MPFFTAMKRIHVARLLMLASAVVPLLSGRYYLWTYLFILALSTELLNAAYAYRKLPGHARFTLFFALFMLFITVHRSWAMWTGWLATAMNLLEHVLFALTICLNLWCWMKVIAPRVRRSVLVAVVPFNLVGIANEVFQDLLNERPLFAWKGDAAKDLAVNAMGSVLFPVLVGRSDRKSPAVVLQDTAHP